MKKQKFEYYILPNIGTSNPDKQLKSEYRIVIIPDNFQFRPKYQIGHNSIKHLRKYSRSWKDLDSKNHKLANKICEERFILDFNDFVLCPMDDNLNEQLYKALIHSFKGEYDKDLKGIHFLSKNHDKIEILQESKPDLNGVWEAEIKVFNERRQKYYLKKTTFFPKNWTPTQLMFECYQALKEINIEDGRNTYESKTLSQVPVKAYYENNKLVSIYPIYKNTETVTNNPS